jgi:fused signal recognition particle receptor
MEIVLIVVGLVLVAAAIAAVLRGRRTLGGSDQDSGRLDPPSRQQPSRQPPTLPDQGRADQGRTQPTAHETTTPVERPASTPPVVVAHDVPILIVEAPVEEPVVEGPDVEGPDVEAPVDVRRPPRFRDRLGKARGALGGYFGGVLGRSTIDQTTWDDLEEALIVADVGPLATAEVLDELKARVKAESIKDPDALMEALKADLKKRLAPGDRTLRFDPGVTNVWLFVGVNGVGKTTTIGKIAKREIESGRSVLMAAGDTFRAAAADQLEMWSQRSGAGFMRGAEGGDPASVIYDGVQKAAASGTQLVLGDTAGRLQTKTNLMEELSKIRRVADKDPGRVTETLLVLDATTGQNGLSQAEQFRGAADITGVVLTKLDGTAKGGIAFAIQTKLGIPIKLVGLGEQVEDLVPFDPDEYVDALFAE